MEIAIRPAEMKDMSALTAILNWHIEHDHASFFCNQLATEASQVEVLKTCGGPYQWWVAECGGEVIGSSKSKQYRQGEIYAATVETGLCLHPDYLGRGIGSLLYSHLLQHLHGWDVHLALAGIAIPNPASVALHRKFGFKEVGVFEEYAKVKGSYFSSLWMQKYIE